MGYYSTPGADFHRPGTVHRAVTLAPVVPSQDVSRYQAKNMPAPTYDLERKSDDRARWLLMPVLAFIVTGAGIFVIQTLGALLAP